jgi:hypothetical protein
VDVAEAGQRVHLGRAMADCPGQLQRLLVVVGGLLVPALPPADLGKADQRVQLTGAVGDGEGGVQGLLVEGFGLVVAAAAAEVPVQDGRQVEEVSRRAVRGSGDSRSGSLLVSSRSFASSSAGRWSARSRSTHRSTAAR